MIRERVETFLKNQYNRENFEFLLRNELFKSSDYSKDVEKLGEVDYKLDKISSYENLGKIEIDGEELNILEFVHDSPNDPRITLTREAFKIMNSFTLEKALAVFNEKNGKNFRLSYLYRDVEFDYDAKKVIETKSPPRRYSFYLGEYARINTPYNYLFEPGEIESLDDLKDRFSVEVVNKEFYSKIARLFTRLTGGKREKENYEPEMILPSLDSKKDHKKFQEFGVRLIGRIIFCWFLKMKKTDSGIPLIPNQLLSRNAVSDLGRDKYYNNVLQNLFFQTLNKKIDERPEYLKDAPYYCDVPFLNGGLFEPHKDDFYTYSQVDDVSGDNNFLNSLKIPDEWFEDLFEVLELYNFTVDENSPVDIELSIDPEMLGRIFENLLAEINPETGATARKQTGSYYTPREIVDYMVNESLRHYLIGKTGIAKDRIDYLLTYIDDDGVELSGEESEAVVKAMDELRIIDPACGSGAFPMGILHKAALVLEKADPEAKKWLEMQIRDIKDQTLKEKIKQKLLGENWSYVRKRGLIEYTVYGVDIQTIAVEISRLRFFLSLIVDTKLESDFHIEPLPNLEFKFAAANTLIPLAGRTTLADTTGDGGRLNEIIHEYYKSHSDEKKKLKEEFYEIQRELMRSSVRAVRGKSRSEQLGEWDPFSDEACQWFDPEIMFGVSNFGIVIANPPYIRQEKIKHLKDDLRRYKVFNSTSDIYTYFYERSYDVLGSGGILTFITSNKWMRAGYGEKLREYIKDRTEVLELIDFGGYKVFDNATVDTEITILRKPIKENKKDSKFIGISIDDEYKKDMDLRSYIEKNGNEIEQKKLSKDVFLITSNIELNLKEKIEEIGTPLRDWNVKIRFGIKTGYNKAFIIDTETKEELCRKDPKSEEIIKPILRGRDISRYSYEWQDLWLIVVKSGFTNKNRGNENPEQFFSNNYNAVYEHLLKYDYNTKGIKNRSDMGDYWWELRKCAYYKDFEKEKIVWGEIVQGTCFAYDRVKMYPEATTFFMTGEKIKYLLGVLNSKFTEYTFKNYFAGGGLGKNGFRFKKKWVETIPIPYPKDEKPITDLVNEILSIKEKDHNADTTHLERGIDELVFELYDLNDKEKAIILNKT